MPLIPVESLLKTIAEQQMQIKELQQSVADLEALLDSRQQQDRINQLERLLKEYPDKLDFSLIASIDSH